MNRTAYALAAVFADHVDVGASAAAAEAVEDLIARDPVAGEVVLAALLARPGVRERCDRATALRHPAVDEAGVVHAAKPRRHDPHLTLDERHLVVRLHVQGRAP